MQDFDTDFATVIERLSANNLWAFPGGVHPDDKKNLSNTTSINRPKLPELLYIPLKQHIGTEGFLQVKEGQRVRKGEPLTGSSHPYAIPVHAPTSGTVVAIGEHVSAHPSGIPEHTLVIKPDGLEEWTELTSNTDYASLDKSVLTKILCDAGISGMGGAGFPTHIKSTNQNAPEFLIINGIECEPYITADDRLMREHAWQIRQGTDILQHIIEPKHVVIAIEDNKPEALEAMRIACKNKVNCSVVSVPTVYPAGGEKQLIQVVTGREVPSEGLPSDIGVIMFNVGTCYAVADAVFHGKPLIERVVTLTGEAVESPQNVWALLGTPVEHLAKVAKLKTSKRAETRIIMGGPMMGFTVTDPLVPVVKITNCLLMPKSNELRQGDNERPCIRCSACSDACPATLLPQQLLWHSKAKEYDKAEDYNLFDCIECGACAYVCPSDIPLVQYYRQAKSAIRTEREEKDKAEKAKLRFEARKTRLEEEKREREEKHRKATEARKAAQLNKTQPAESTTTDEKPKSAAVAAAIARAKAKKQADDDKAKVVATVARAKANVEQATSTESEEDAKKAKVAAAVARAKAKRDAEKQASSEAQPVSERVGDDPKKAKIAAAVARAKAKKQQQELAESAIPDTEQPVSNEEDVKKAKIAAAVARAKAKKQAEQQASQVQAKEPEATSEEDEKKAKIAAAVARAKAKAKAKAEQEKAEGESK
jgi:electron transport complex protein RnfC